MKKIRMYILRHGRQSSALCNVNVPLAEEGKRQAELAGDRLKDKGIQAVYSSDLIRAVETADIINKRINVKHESLPGLREIDFGELTGMKDSDIKQKYAGFFKEREKYECDLAFPGGECGAQVYERVKEAFADIVSQCERSNYTAVAVVTHGGAIRSFLAGILGMPQEYRFLFAKTMENTSITEVNYDIDEKRYYVERINDYAHLEAYPELMRCNFK